MGTFPASIEIGDPEGRRWVVVDALVDTGSTYTWVPRELLERLGVHGGFPREFETADGRVIRRDMAVTTARWEGEVLPTLVVVAEPEDGTMIGAYTLEGFGLAADPVNRRMVRVRGLAMRGSGPFS